MAALLLSISNFTLVNYRYQERVISSHLVVDLKNFILVRAHIIQSYLCLIRLFIIGLWEYCAK